MQQLRRYHRLATLLAIFFILFLAVTGLLIQAVDLRSLVMGAPAADANVRAMREGFDGPGYYVVRRTADYDAPGLPPTFDYRRSLHLALDRAIALGIHPVDSIEFRVANGIPIVQIGVGKGHVRLDAASGSPIERTAIDVPDEERPVSLRNDVKRLHRMTSFGLAALVVNVCVALALLTLIATGAIIYWKLYAMRRRLHRPALFWKGGGTWRMLHRSIAAVAAAFLLIVVASGGWLAVESLYKASVEARPGAKDHAAAIAAAARAPLDPAQDLAEALRTTLAAYRADADEAPVVAVRLRRFAGYLQGIVVTGGTGSRQLVYDARTGREMSTTEPGYPPIYFPFGWHAHQVAKSIHRGDIVGLPGRIMDMLAGLALLYLAISGGQLYYAMWRNRQRGGRAKLIWK